MENDFREIINKIIPYKEDERLTKEEMKGLFNIVENVAVYLGEPQTRMFLTYKDDELEISSDCLTSTNKVFYKGRLVFCYSSSPYTPQDSVFVSGEWQDHLQKLHKKARNLMESKTKSIESYLVK